MCEFRYPIANSTVANKLRDYAASSIMVLYQYRTYSSLIRCLHINTQRATQEDGDKT